MGPCCTSVKVILSVADLIYLIIFQMILIEKRI